MRRAEHELGQALLEAQTAEWELAKQRTIIYNQLAALANDGDEWAVQLIQEAGWW